MTVPTIQATPEAVANYLLTCNLLELSKIQHILAAQGIELQVGTGELISIPDPDKPYG